MKKISFIIPCHNEEENVVRLHSALERFTQETFEVNDVRMDMKNFEWEFLFVNDGSKDDTLRALRILRREDARVSVLNLSRNFGKESAMLAGLDYASGDAAVIIDADLQTRWKLCPR